MDVDVTLYNAIVYSQGCVEVTNYGGKYAKVKDGVYSVRDRFGETYPNKTKSQVLEIFKKLVHKYMNLEVDGVLWTYSGGQWKSRKVNPQR